ncbi:hypothetical protein, partial [Salmonella enterica]|uniref:hypothetical protein n=1 Tax=Salmonella enterica TaxID=28901 RepID=UPI0028E07397
RLAVQRLISSSIVMLMSVISTHYDLSRISVGHYICLLHYGVKRLPHRNNMEIIKMETDL